MFVKHFAQALNSGSRDREKSEAEKQIALRSDRISHEQVQQESQIVE